MVEVSAGGRLETYCGVVGDARKVPIATENFGIDGGNFDLAGRCSLSLGPIHYWQGISASEHFFLITVQEYVMTDPTLQRR